jgi:hypothetical protein
VYLTHCSRNLFISSYGCPAVYTAQQYYTVEDVVNITVTGQTVIDVNCKETVTGAGVTVDNFVEVLTVTR